MSLLPSKPDTSAVDDGEPRVIGVDSDEADDVISALSSETARKLLAELHQDPAPPSELSERVDTSLQNAQYHLQKLESAGAVSVVDTAYSAKGREMDVYAPADQPLVIFAGDEDRTTGLKAALSRLLGGVGVLALGSLAVQQLYGQADPAVPSSGGETGGTAGGNGGAGGAGGAASDGNATAGTATAQDDGASYDTTGERAQETVTAEPAQTVEQTAEGGEGGDVGLFSENLTNTGEDGTVEMTDGAVETTTTAAEATATDSAGQTTATASDGAAQTTASNATELTTQAADAAVQTTDTAAQTTDAAASMAGLPPGLLFFAGGLLVLALWLVVWYVDLE